VSHRNARTTFVGRKLIVERYRQGWTQAQIAEAMGIWRKCVKTWLDRFAAEGEAGLHDRSSRPHRSPTRTPAAVEQRVVQARQQHRRGQDWLADHLAELGVSARTIGRILRRRNLPYLRHCDPITGLPIKAGKTTAVRYERDRPGELVHVDVKKLARIPDGGGWRVHGRSEAVRGRGNGYDFVHSMVDDHSRLAYSEVLPDEKGPTCAAFVRRAAAFFTACGITRIGQVMTDNAFAYRHSRDFAAAVTELGAEQVFIKPHCPWQNGKVERFNRTLLTEWAYRQAFSSNTERTQALAGWLTYYNTQRRHSALAGQPPITRLQPTS